MTDRTDLPTVEDDTREYWAAARDGTLLLARCGDCGHVHHYPRAHCPECWGENLETVEASGFATLYTYSTVYLNDLPPFAERVPYVAAMVDLAEGPRIMTNVVGCEPADLRIGMPLEVTGHRLTDELVAPVFRAARASTTD